MNKTMTINLPSLFKQSVDVDRPSLSLLRAALVVGEHIVDQRSRNAVRNPPLQEAAHLVHAKIKELLGFLDVYEHRLATTAEDEDDIAF